ncbi:SEC22B [Cordylochernes scorpioides]|uniref:SEC22B n=1 Tax=Cordylochernes scorpioides TaxID=51811 RepID=A0ABY6LEP0_9ARAC|nr:SEC22B [Cordylochernes scorpioides]
MVLMCIIARLGDGLPLAGSVEKDEALSRKRLEFQNQAKTLFKKLDVNSPKRASIETSSYIFHCVVLSKAAGCVGSLLIENNVVFLVLCETNFSRKLAFAFLEDIQTEFSLQFGPRIPTATRPYPFIEFERYIEKAKKTYMDARARRNLSNLNTELQDVTRIMVQNIDDVLQRGTALSELDHKASNLSMLSQKYRKDAHYLNLRSTYAKAAAAGVLMFVLVLYFFVF